MPQLSENFRFLFSFFGIPFLLYCFLFFLTVQYLRLSNQKNNEPANPKLMKSIRFLSYICLIILFAINATVALASFVGEREIWLGFTKASIFTVFATVICGYYMFSCTQIWLFWNACGILFYGYTIFVLYYK